jgi:hypothetical protein
LISNSAASTREVRQRPLDNTDIVEKYLTEMLENNSNQCNTGNVMSGQRSNRYEIL